MKYSYNWLKEYVPKLPGPEKLAEGLTMRSLEVEEIKKDGNDHILDIDVLSNRVHDCASHVGIAREAAAAMGIDFKFSLLQPKEDNKQKTGDFIKIEVKNGEDCPRYTARVATDLKVGPSPQWLKNKLIACGLRPINNIVDIMNYVMLEVGQPLHAFDREKLAGGKIIVRRAKKGERIITLDNEEYSLDNNVLVIADSEKPIAIAGIKGGITPEVSNNTKTIIIESATFNPTLIRKASRGIGLRTDASARFEGDLDPNLAEEAINRAASLVQKIAKGKIIGGVVDVYPKKAFPKRIKLDLIYLTRLLGCEIKVNETKKILKRLGFTILDHKDSVLEVEIPTRRRDISIPEDLIEEIGRIYGYENISAELPQACLISPKRNERFFWGNMVKDIFKELGFSESYNYSFINLGDIDAYGLQKDQLLEVLNPISLDYQYLRPNLIINLLKNVRDNFKNFKGMKIFELDKIYIGPSDKMIEKIMLTGIIAEEKEIFDNGFYEAKGVIDSFLNKIGISDILYNPYHTDSANNKEEIWNIQKCAEIKIGRDKIGFLGKVSPNILKKLKIKGVVVIFDIDFEKIIDIALEEHEYQPISRFPSAVRDLALLVPRGVLVEEALNKINVAGGSLVRDVDLFDMYEGEAISQGKKNLAFHIIYQAEDRTLESSEIDRLHRGIIKVLEENAGWQVRA